MKILSIYGVGGSNEFQNELPIIYPGSKSISFMHSYQKSGEKMAFDELYAALDEKPEIIICFQFYDCGGTTESHVKFLKEASKTGQLFLYAHDSPPKFGKIETFQRFEKVFMCNFKRMKTLRKLGITAKFLPMACSKTVHISLNPFNPKANFVASICFFIQWLCLDKEPLNFGIGGPDRGTLIKKLLLKKIPIRIYGPQELKDRVSAIPVDKSSLTFGRINPYTLHRLPAFKAFFNGVFHSGELSINNRFYEVLGIGGTQIYPSCPHFQDFCNAFFGEIPNAEETPVVLYDDDNDFVEKAVQLLKESDAQSIARRRKATIYRERWTISKMIRIVGGDEKNPADAME